MNRVLLFAFCVASSLSFAQHSALGNTTIFTEDFTDSSARWANFSTTAVLDYSATGGPDGGAFASGPRAFGTLTPGNITVILRARHEDPWNASDDAFHRNWNADGIRRVSAYVMHDLPEALRYFVRVAGPGGFPGGTFASLSTVPANEWTKIDFDVSANSPQLPSPDALEGQPWEATFNDVGHVQFGVYVPTGYSGNSTAYRFSIDKVTIATPEPASAILGLLGLIACASQIRGRTRKSCASC